MEASRPTKQLPHRLILGTRVDVTSYSDAAQQIAQWAAAGESRYVCVCNVHMLMEAHDDLRFLQVVNGADLTTPDGMPVVWALKWLGAREATRVDGAGLILRVLAQAAKRKLPLALYGGTEESTSLFIEFVRRQYPGVEIAGVIRPPFRPPTAAEDAAYTRQLVDSGARIVFVSMGCPKQEKWMAVNRHRIPAVLVGVGAAIDFHAGTVKRAPLWMQRVGLEWFFRFCQEPRRLWHRYAYHNPRFLWMLLRQILGGDYTARQSPAPFWRYPRSFWIYVRHLRPSQQLTTATIEARQMTRLRGLLHDATRHVPYYRDLFARLGATPEDFRTLADLRRLPVLTKQQVRDDPYQFLHDHTHPRRLIEDHTSGSTGQPLEFYLTAEQKAWDMACAIRFWHWIGYRTGARIAAFRHYQPSSPTALPWNYERHSNTLFFSVYDMTPDNLRRYAAEFNRFRPQYVRGYPSSIFAFAQFAASEGLPLHTPRAVLTSSETLAPEMRAVIERVLQCPVYDWWGSNERLGTACQCEQRGPYHVNAEAGILELVPEQSCGTGPITCGSGLPAATGMEPPPSLHRLVATGLLNHAMPLIRYDLGDYAVPATAPCACGRGLPSLERILGRANDLIITGEGKRIPSVRFYTIFETHTAIRQFQVQQTAPDAVQVRLVAPRPLASADLDRLRIELTRFLGDQVRLQFDYVADIPPEPSGKLRNVISLVRS